MRGVCFIVGAAPGALPPLDRQADDLVIAADGGLLACEAAGLVPDLIVGDFDSLGRVPAGDSVVRLAVEKDDTDTAHAVDLGLARGYERFLLLGVTGGDRPDHTFASLTLAAHLSMLGKRCLIAGDGWLVTAVTDGALRFGAEHRGDLSVFAFGGEARGVTETGLRYSLDRATLQSSVALGVSNSFLGQESRVSVEHGTLLLFYRGTPPLSIGESCGEAFL